MKLATTVANLVKSTPEADKIVGAVKVMFPKLAFDVNNLLKLGSASEAVTSVKVLSTPAYLSGMLV